MSEAPNPTPAPAPAPDPAAAPPAETGAPITASETGAPPASPSGEATTPAAEPAPPVEGAPDEAALAIVPETADGYALTISDAAKTALGSLEGDPAIQALRDLAKEKGWTQGQFNDRIGTAIDALAEKGLLVPSFDPAAETAKLSAGGKDGPARQQEVQVFADSLKARGDIDDAEYGELMSLAPTAAGVTLVEKLRALAAGRGTGPDGEGAATTGDALKAEAREMRRDPRYETDPTFKGQADKKYKEAWGIK